MIPARSQKITMAELKLRRLTEHDSRLREDLARPRTNVSEASRSLINYTASVKDPLLPSLWGMPEKGKDPYAPVQQAGGCCLMM